MTTVKENRTYSITEFHKFIDILVKTFISVIALSCLDLTLSFHLGQENIQKRKNSYFKHNNKMDKNGKFAYIRVSKDKFMNFDMVKSNKEELIVLCTFFFFCFMWGLF